MATIGFVGPGIMGRPMAANLVRAGHDVRCYGRSAASRSRAADTGAVVVDSIAAACDGAEFVLTMLPDSPDVLAATMSDDGVLAALSPGACLIDHSTISPEAALTVHAAARTAGIAFLDAPVSGGEAGAVEGTLSIMVGGDVADFSRARPVLDLLGTTVVLVGPPGSGQVVKAANQLVVAGNLQFLAEAVVFLRAHGADLDAALDVLAGGLAGSTALQRKRTNLTTEQYAPGFRVSLHDKDFGIITRAVREKGLALPATTLVASLMASLRARGNGDLDHSALLKLALELNGAGSGETAES